MNWFFALKKESLKNRIFLSLRMLGSALLGCFMAILSVYFLLSFVHEDQWVSSRCDLSCSRTLVLSGVSIFLPFLFIPSWALLTYLLELVIQKKIQGIPNYGVGFISILIFLISCLAALEIQRASGVSVLDYLQAVEDWREGSLSKETLEFLSRSVRYSPK